MLIKIFNQLFYVNLRINGLIKTLSFDTQNDFDVSTFWDEPATRFVSERNEPGLNLKIIGLVLDFEIRNL